MTPSGSDIPPVSDDTAPGSASQGSPAEAVVQARDAVRRLAAALHVSLPTPEPSTLKVPTPRLPMPKLPMPTVPVVELSPPGLTPPTNPPREPPLPQVGLDVPEQVRRTTIAALREAGARFALLHGSRAAGTHRPDSDVDVAAWWGDDAPASFEVDLPRGVDLIVLDTAPLELAGRIAVGGILFFDDDPAARVRWVATTRKIWFDERPRFERAHREFLESLRRGR